MNSRLSPAAEGLHAHQTQRIEHVHRIRRAFWLLAGRLDLQLPEAPTSGSRAPRFHRTKADAEAAEEFERTTH
jgi:hypothetical protein